MLYEVISLNDTILFYTVLYILVEKHHLLGNSFLKKRFCCLKNAKKAADDHVCFLNESIIAPALLDARFDSFFILSSVLPEKLSCHRVSRRVRVWIT